MAVRTLGSFVAVPIDTKSPANRIRLRMLSMDV
jgi:hypothetical protein